jgi:hypothetical protein
VALADLAPSRAAGSSAWYLTSAFYGALAVLLSLITLSNHYVECYLTALKEAEMFRNDIVSDKDSTKLMSSRRHGLCVNCIDLNEVPKITVSKNMLNRITKGIRLSKNEKA